MAANIVTIINGDETTKKIGMSRDDLKIGDIVQCLSLDSAVDTGYSWSFSHIPETSETLLTTDDNSCEFEVDAEGPYLVRLVVDPGSEFEDSQYLRLRSLTRFGSLRLVAAGEQLGDLAIPSDMTGTGWAQDQNFNLSTLVSELSTLATSGRVLYVDPNRGVDDTIEPNEDLSGYGNFHSIQEAIDAATAHIVSPASVENEWTIIIQQGLFVETLTIPKGVNLFGNENVVIESEDDDTKIHTVNGGHIKGITFQSNNPSDAPILEVLGDCEFSCCHILRVGNNAGQGACVKVSSGQAELRFSEIGNNSHAVKSSIAIAVDGSGSLRLEDCYVYGAEGIVIYEGGGDAEILRSVVEANHPNGSAVLSSGTLEIAYSDLISDNDQSLKVTPSDTDPTGGGQTYVRFSKIMNSYDYDFGVEVSDLKLEGVEFENRVEFHSDLDLQNDLYVGGSIQISELNAQPVVGDQPSLWADQNTRLFINEDKLAFESEVQDVATDVSTLEKQVADLQNTITDMQSLISTLQTQVTDLENNAGSGGDAKLNILHRKVVEELEYTCHECDEYIGVRTEAGQEHIINLLEDAVSGTRLYIVDETGLGTVLIRPVSAVADPTINETIGDYVLENREGVHIVSDGQTDGAAVNWVVS